MCMYACMRVFGECIFVSEDTCMNEVIWQVCVCLCVTLKIMVDDLANQNTDFRVVT